MSRGNITFLLIVQGLKGAVTKRKALRVAERDFQSWCMIYVGSLTTRLDSGT
jgi:hypothetical protein